MIIRHYHQRQYVKLTHLTSDLNDTQLPSLQSVIIEANTTEPRLREHAERAPVIMMTDRHTVCILIFLTSHDHV